MPYFFIPHPANSKCSIDIDNSVLYLLLSDGMRGTPENDYRIKIAGQHPFPPASIAVCEIEALACFFCSYSPVGEGGLMFKNIIRALGVVLIIAMEFLIPILVIAWIIYLSNLNN